MQLPETCLQWILGEALLGFKSRRLQVAQVEVQVAFVVGRDEDRDGDLGSLLVALYDHSLSIRATQFVGPRSRQRVVIPTQATLAPVQAVLGLQRGFVSVYLFVEGSK